MTSPFIVARIVQLPWVLSGPAAPDQMYLRAANFGLFDRGT
jgi:hypothetical protein